MTINPWGECDAGAFEDYFFKTTLSLSKCQIHGGGGCMTLAMDTLPPSQQNIELQALGVVIVVTIVTEARSP